MELVDRMKKNTTAFACLLDDEQAALRKAIGHLEVLDSVSHHPKWHSSCVGSCGNENFSGGRTYRIAEDYTPYVDPMVERHDVGRIGSGIGDNDRYVVEQLEDEPLVDVRGLSSYVATVYESTMPDGNVYQHTKYLTHSSKGQFQIDFQLLSNDDQCRVVTVPKQVIMRK